MSVAWQWPSFLVVIAVALFVDLVLLNKEGRAPSSKTALKATCGWIMLSMMLALGLYLNNQPQMALEFVTAYIVELSLSVDNVFVFVLIFQYFKITPSQQRRILFWGVLGAVLMRFVMIIFGAYLIHKFEFLLYIFGAFLIYSAYKLLSMDLDKKGLGTDDRTSTFLKKYFPFTDRTSGDRFVTTHNGKLMFTPLALVLILVEQSDIVFALDSIPAVLSISQDSFVIFSSNIMAILGLRSLYLVLAKMIDKFVYLHYALSIILGFIGCKMLLLAINIKIPTSYSLAIIFITLAVTMLASSFKNRHK